MLERWNGERQGLGVGKMVLVRCGEKEGTSMMMQRRGESRLKVMRTG